MRLVPALVGTWAGVLAGLSGFASPAGALAVGLLALAGGIALRWRSARWAAALVVLTLVIGAAQGAHTQALARADPLTRLLTAEPGLICTVEGVVERGWRSGVSGVAVATLSLRASELVGSGTVATTARARLFSPAPRERLEPGQRVRARVRLSAAEPGAVSGRVSGPVRIVSTPRWARLRTGLIDSARRTWANVAEPARGLGLGMTLGLRDEVDPALVEDLRASGLAHLTAVSGLHLAYVAGIALAITAPFRHRARAVTSALLLAGYIGLVGPSGSVMRAGAMTAISLLGLALARSNQACAGLSGACVLALLINPRLAVDLGFCLSVAATGAIVVAAEPAAESLVDHGLPRGLAQAIAVAACAQIACTPLLVLMRPALPLAGVAANVLAAPALAPALGLGLAANLLGGVWPAAGEATVWAVSWPLAWICAVARRCALEVAWAGGPAGAVLAGGTCACVLYLWWVCDPIASTRRWVRRRRLRRGEGGH